MELRPILSAMTRRKTGVLLIALQVALTLAILSNTLYVVRDRLVEANQPSGLDEDVVLHVTLRDNERDVTGGVIDGDLDALRGIPGVMSAAFVDQIPLSNSGSNSAFDRRPDADSPSTSAATYSGDASLLDTWGLRLVAGRGFRSDEVTLRNQDDGDVARSRVVIVTSAMAKSLFPEAANVVGKIIYQGTGTPPQEIVGVVDQLITPWGKALWNVSNDGTRSVIFPERVVNTGLTYAVRVAPGELDRVAAGASDALAARVPGRIMGSISTMAETRESRYRGEHTVVNGLLIVIGLLLAMTASGVVGLASLWVNQRRKQIGVRRALGARRRDIVRYFLLENLLITSGGIALGCVLALALNQLMMRQLDLARLPLEFLAGGAVTLLLLGLAAVYGPARRASRVPPAVATRSV